MSKEQKTKLDEHTRMKLLGLKTLAIDLNSKIDMVVEMAKEITGDVEDGGWATDFVFDQSVTPERLWEMTEKWRKG